MVGGNLRGRQRECEKEAAHFQFRPFCSPHFGEQRASKQASGAPNRPQPATTLASLSPAWPPDRSGPNLHLHEPNRELVAAAPVLV